MVRSVCHPDRPPATFPDVMTDEPRPIDECPPDDEAGAVTLFAVIATTILVLFVGIAVDLSGKLHALQRAQDVARQAARAAAQAAEGPSVVRGGAARVDPARAAQAAQAYLNTAGVTGSVSVSGDLVTVRTSATYTPVMLSLAGVATQSVSGESTARLYRVAEGVAR